MDVGPPRFVEQAGDRGPDQDEERAQRDDVEMLSSWSIQNQTENHFTINGKEYPADILIFATGFQNWGACLDCRVKPGNEG